MNAWIYRSVLGLAFLGVIVFSFKVMAEPRSFDAHLKEKLGSAIWGVKSESSNPTCWTVYGHLHKTVYLHYDDSYYPNVKIYDVAVDPTEDVAEVLNDMEQVYLERSRGTFWNSNAEIDNRQIPLMVQVEERSDRYRIRVVYQYCPDRKIFGFF